MNTFLQEGHIKLIKSDSKDIYNVAKYVYFQIIVVFLKLMSHLCSSKLSKTLQLTQNFEW